MKRLDCIVVLAQFDMWCVYEPIKLYRNRTLDRLDELMRLADRLEDEHSGVTLYGNLLFRLGYER